MREVVLDTETTGLNPGEGHRIIEIGALEMVNHIPTGKTYHVYINPERVVDPDSIAVHGLTNEFLDDKPLFADIVDDIMAFLGDSRLVIHNAAFDMGFINAELERLGHDPLPMDRSLDTLALARSKFPGARANLDALCRRFSIDNSHRDLHGAMIDTDLLAEVYIELIGGRQMGLSFTDTGAAAPVTVMDTLPVAAATSARKPRQHAASAEELKAHQEFVEKLKNPLWLELGTTRP
tara:strand:+ start:655 stop:1362 length:708 start_codon:yes stop_codon:yes gene_type:complete